MAGTGGNQPSFPDVNVNQLRRDEHVHFGQFIEQQPATRVDYIEFFDPKTLEPVERVSSGIHMSLAVFVGKTRLIDNALLK